MLRQRKLPAAAVAPLTRRENLPTAVRVAAALPASKSWAQAANPAKNAKAAVKALGLPVEVEYITDMEKVMGYGVMSMPAIVVNEKVVSMGKVLKAADVEKLLHKLGC